MAEEKNDGLNPEILLRKLKQNLARKLMAGEVPVSELERLAGLEKKRVPSKDTEFLKKGRNINGDELQELFRVVDDYRSKKISKEDMDNFIVTNEIQIRRIKRFKTETVQKTKEYEIVIPISTLNWGSHETIVDQGISAYVLSRELCETLELTARAQTFDLYDKNNRRASITLRWGDAWHNFHKLIYIRQDLVEKYLIEKGLELIWGVWGERRYKSKDNIGLLDFAKKHQSYKVFQKILAYRDIIAGNEAA